MIGALKTVSVYVEDQQRAMEFYVGKLGFVIRRSLRMGSAPGNWIEVSPPGGGTCLVLHPKSMMPDWAERKPSMVFYCPDVERTCAELARRGVSIGSRGTPRVRQR